MGHNQKNNNRAAAITRNTERYEGLKVRVKALELEAKGQRRALEIEAGQRLTHEAALLDRIERLERSTYAKVRDGLRALRARYFPKIPNVQAETGFKIVSPTPALELMAPDGQPVPAGPLEDAVQPSEPWPEPDPLEVELPPPALEIVEAPRGQGKTTEAERAAAAELIQPPATPIEKLAQGMAELEAHKLANPRPAELEVEPPSVGERFTTLKALARDAAAETFDKGATDDD